VDRDELARVVELEEAPLPRLGEHPLRGPSGVDAEELRAHGHHRSVIRARDRTAIDLRIHEPQLG
jgi:hypothetical protein